MFANKCRNILIHCKAGIQLIVKGQKLVKIGIFCHHLPLKLGRLDSEGKSSLNWLQCYKWFKILILRHKLAYVYLKTTIPHKVMFSLSLVYNEQNGTHCYQMFNNIAINLKKSVRSNRVLVATELLVSGTQCNIMISTKFQ